MKKVILYLICVFIIFAFSCSDDNHTLRSMFPDDIFRKYCERFDKNRDGVLSEEEIAAVTTISLYHGREPQPYMDLYISRISTLKGIECFTNLMALYCYEVELPSLDLSNNKKLKYLYCPLNELSTLSLSRNTALQLLECYVCKLTRVDVSNCTDLKYLECSYNQLSSLDVSNNTALDYLSCNVNRLTYLDVSNNTKLKQLKCSINQLTTLSLGKNTALEYLYCNNNQLSELDISGCTSLKTLNCENNANPLVITVWKGFNIANPLESLDIKYDEKTTTFVEVTS